MLWIIGLVVVVVDLYHRLSVPIDTVLEVRNGISTTPPPHPLLGKIPSDEEIETLLSKIKQSSPEEVSKLVHELTGNKSLIHEDIDHRDYLSPVSSVQFLKLTQPPTTTTPKPVLAPTIKDHDQPHTAIRVPVTKRNSLPKENRPLKKELADQTSAEGAYHGEVAQPGGASVETQSKPELQKSESDTQPNEDDGGVQKERSELV